MKIKDKFDVTIVEPTILRPRAHCGFRGEISPGV